MSCILKLVCDWQVIYKGRSYTLVTTIKNKNCLSTICGTNNNALFVSNTFCVEQGQAVAAIAQNMVFAALIAQIAAVSGCCGRPCELNDTVLWKNLYSCIENDIE